MERTPATPVSLPCSVWQFHDRLRKPRLVHQIREAFRPCSENGRIASLVLRLMKWIRVSVGAWRESQREQSPKLILRARSPGRLGRLALGEGEP